MYICTYIHTYLIIQQKSTMVEFTSSNPNKQPSSVEKSALCRRPSHHQDVERRRLLKQSIVSYLSDDDRSLGSCSSGSQDELDDDSSVYDNSSDEDSDDEEDVQAHYRFEAAQRRKEVKASNGVATEGVGEHRAATPGELLSKYLSDDAGWVAGTFQFTFHIVCSLFFLQICMTKRPLSPLCSSSSFQPKDQCTMQAHGQELDQYSSRAQGMQICSCRF
jgi:hypothetical protein